jgi:hypothetical protein
VKLVGSVIALQSLMPEFMRVAQTAMCCENWAALESAFVSRNMLFLTHGIRSPCLAVDDFCTLTEKQEPLTHLSNEENAVDPGQRFLVLLPFETIHNLLVLTLPQID